MLHYTESDALFKMSSGTSFGQKLHHLPMHTPHRSKLSRGSDFIGLTAPSRTACRLPVWDTLCCELTCRVSQRELIFLFADTNVPSSKEILTTIRLGHLTELAVHLQRV